MTMSQTDLTHAPQPYQTLRVVAPSASPGFTLESGHLQPPGRGEVMVQVAAASVNPIDVKRAQGHGQRLLRFKGAARFPLNLGNDLAGHVLAVGRDAGDWAVGDRVFGLRPMGHAGTHATLVNVQASHLRRAPHTPQWQHLCTLPYSYTTLRLALEGAGLTPESARGRSVLVQGASGALGRLALQTLTHWGARLTAVCGPAGVADCFALGAQAVLERGGKPLQALTPVFDASLNFADWSQEAWTISRLKPGALGHATTVHPLLQNFDRLGWLGGMWQTRRDRSGMTQAAREATGGACRYAWTVFKHVPQYLDDLQRDIHKLGLHLPVGLAVPLREADKAFEHTRRGGRGRAILLCTGESGRRSVL